MKYREWKKNESLLVKITITRNLKRESELWKWFEVSSADRNAATNVLWYRSCCCWRRAAALERARTSVSEHPPPAPSSSTRTPVPPAASSWPFSPSSDASGLRLTKKWRKYVDTHTYEGFQSVISKVLSKSQASRLLPIDLEVSVFRPLLCSSEVSCRSRLSLISLSL